MKTKYFRLVLSCFILSGFICNVKVSSQVSGSTQVEKRENPDLFFNPRFSDVKITSEIKFAEVVNYKGKTISLFLDIYQPDVAATTLRPAIIWIHGGGFRSGSSRDQNYIVNFSTDFAKRGYVCLSIDYRCRDAADMPDRASELPALQDAARDANTALDWVRENSAKYGINPNAIFVAGGSAGGRTAITVCQFDGPDVSALYAPETRYKEKQWDKTGIIATACLWGAPEPEMRDWLYPYLTKTDIPSILIHGEKDVTIPAQNSIDLDKALKSAGVNSELHIIPGAAHTPTRASTYPQIVDWVARFFVNEWKKREGNQ